MLIFAAILAIFVYGMIAAMLGTILPDLSERFHLTPTQNGTIALCAGIGPHDRFSVCRSAARYPGRQDRPGAGAHLYRCSAFCSAAIAAVLAPLCFCCFCSASAEASWLRAPMRSLRLPAPSTEPPPSTSSTSFWFGWAGDAVRLRQSLQEEPVALCYAIATVTVVTLAIQAVTPMPAPTGNASFVLAGFGPILGNPLLLMLGLFLFLYIGCEVGVWNWLPRHLIAQGIPESQRTQHPVSRICAGPAGWPRRRLTDPDSCAGDEVTLAASVAMAMTTFLMLRTNSPGAAAALVFLPGLSMAPVFPTDAGHCGHRFPRMTGTAIGFAITCGWAGLAVSSRIIGAIAGGDPLRLRKALLLIPGSAVLMIGLNLAIRTALR